MSSSAMNMPTHMTTKGSQASHPAFGGRRAGHCALPEPDRVSTLTVVDRPGRSAREHRVVVERDADGNALNDLGEVAGGVFGRDHAEDGARGRGEADDMPVKGMVRQDVGDDRRGLPGAIRSS